MRAWIVVGLAVASMLAARPAAAGKLGDARAETQGSSGSSGSSDSGGSSSEDSSSEDSSSDHPLLGAVAAAVGEAMLEAYAQSVWRLYTRYPYEPGTHGHVHVIPHDTPEDAVRPGRRFSGSLAIDGAVLGSTVGRAGVDLQLMVRRFGFALDFSPHIEVDPSDALMLGRAALMVAPVLRPRWQLYAGAGVGVMIDGRVLPPDRRADAAGFAATFQTTVLPVRPMVVRGRFDVGTLGAATTMLGRATVGVMVRRWEIFGGYEARAIGSVVLHGPTTGIRAWF